MKRSLSFILGLLSVSIIMAQAPKEFSYQAVIRDNANKLLDNKQVGVKVTILDNAISVYEETHTATSNDNGLITLEIGNGTVVSGTFAGIDWANGDFSIKIETDPQGGSNYSISSTARLLSVPFALHAANGLSDGAVAGNTPYWDGGKWVANSSNLFNNGGNVGIGTSTPNFKLEVQGSLMVNSSFGSINYGIPNGNGWRLSTVGGGTNLQLSDIVGGSTNALRMYFEGGTGNIGIGTSSPLGKLDVRNSTPGMVAAFHAPSNLYVGLYEGASYRGYVGSFSGNDEDVDIGSSTGSVHLVTGANINLTAKNGNVGIGTTNPASTLDVNKSGNGMALKLNATDQVFMGLYENNIYRGYIGSYYGNIADVDVGSFSGAVHLVNGSNINLTAKSGKVGIGTTDPVQLLHVNSSTTDAFIKVVGGSNSSNVGLDLVRNGGGRQWRIMNAGLFGGINAGSL